MKTVPSFPPLTLTLSVLLKQQWGLVKNTSVLKKASQHIHQKIKFKMLFVCLASPVKSTEINFYLSLGGFFMFAFLLFMWNEKAPTDLKSKLKVLNLTHCAEMLNI